jgi:cytoskeletal protein RodZ
MRESAGLTVEDISVETKVSSRILRALEAGDFRHLPEKVFCRSFVTQYAHTIGIDDGPLVSEFDRAWEFYTVSSGTHPNLSVETRDLGFTIRWRFWIPITIGALILIFAAIAILGGRTSAGDGLQPDPRRSGARQVAAAMPTQPPALATTAQRTAAPIREPTGDSVVRMTVEVDDGEECWIQYRDGDGMTGQRLLANGQQLALELVGPVKLTVGNAGAVRLIIDGRTYHDLGLPGQVIHTEVTQEGFMPLGTTGVDG